MTEKKVKRERTAKQEKTPRETGGESVKRRRVKRVRRPVTRKKKNSEWKKASSRRMWLYVLLLLVVLSLAGWRLWRSDAVQMRFVYMWPYQNEIVTYA